MIQILSSLLAILQNHKYTYIEMVVAEDDKSSHTNFPILNPGYIVCNRQHAEQLLLDVIKFSSTFLTVVATKKCHPLFKTCEQCLIVA